MARFFIDRPVFAIVVSLVITIAGLLALTSLPVAQYPRITLPTINISTAIWAPTPRWWSRRWRSSSSSR
jgi:multidrug efflux pump